MQSASFVDCILVPSTALPTTRNATSRHSNSDPGEFTCCSMIAKSSITAFRWELSRSFARESKREMKIDLRIIS